jgi:hypothetical protein
MALTATYPAAWVPDDDPERPWDEAADLAVQWALARADELGVDPLLVTYSQHQWSAGADSIRWMAQRCGATTPRSKGAVPGPHAVVAYVPDWQVMELAVHSARGGCLAVVESVSTPLAGWAMEAQALDLTTGQVTVDTRSARLMQDLEHISFVGNNGWGDQYGKRDAQRVISGLRTAHELDSDLVLGTMLARGHGHRGIERLEKLLERAS